MPKSEKERRVEAIEEILRNVILDRQNIMFHVNKLGEKIGTAGYKEEGPVLVKLFEVLQKASDQAIKAVAAMQKEESLIAPEEEDTDLSPEDIKQAIKDGQK